MLSFLVQVKRSLCALYKCKHFISLLITGHNQKHVYYKKSNQHKYDSFHTLFCQTTPCRTMLTFRVSSADLTQLLSIISNCVCVCRQPRLC